MRNVKGTGSQKQGCVQNLWGPVQNKNTGILVQKTGKKCREGHKNLRFFPFFCGLLGGFFFLLNAILVKEELKSLA